MTRPQFTSRSLDSQAAGGWSPFRFPGGAALGAIFSLLLVFAAQPAAAQTFESTVIVSPVPGDPAASGLRLQQALATLEADSQNPGLVKIEPGIYDVGPGGLPLRPWIDVEGSGPGVTTILGHGQPFDGDFDFTRGVVMGADRTTIRSLAIVCTTSSAEGCILVANIQCNPQFEDLVLVAKGDGINWGVRNTTATATFDRVEIFVSGSLENYGMVNAFISTTSVHDSTISATGGSYLNVGILDRDRGIAASIERTRIWTSGGNRSIGLYAATSHERTVEIVDSSVLADGPAGQAIAGSGFTLRARSVRLEGSQSAIDLGDEGTVDVVDSDLDGGVRAGTVLLGATRLRGAAVIDATTASCAAVYTLEPTPVFFAQTCPAALRGGGKDVPLMRLHSAEWREPSGR